MTPTGGYAGVKAALVPLHVQFDPVARRVWLINSDGSVVDAAAVGLEVRATIFALNGTTAWQGQAPVTQPVPADSATPLPLEIPSAELAVYFLRLQAVAHNGSCLDENTYWLSAQPDTLDWANSNFYRTPCSSYANFTALQSLPPTKVIIREVSSLDYPRDERIFSVTNVGPTLAFFVELDIMPFQVRVAQPVLWSPGRYIPLLLPMETRTVSLRHALPGASISHRCFNQC